MNYRLCYALLSAVFGAPSSTGNEQAGALLLRGAPGSRIGAEVALKRIALSLRDCWPISQGTTGR